MVNKDFFAALEELCVSKGIDRQAFLDTLQNALTSAYKKYAGDATDVVIKYNEEKCAIKFYACKQIVEEVVDPAKEITLEDAKLLKKSYKLGDTYEKEFIPKEFGRIAAQTAKQVVMQRLREAERSKLMDEVNTKQDELVTGIVRRIEGDNVYVDLGMTQIEGVLSLKDQIPGEKYKINDRIKVVVKTIKEGYSSSYVQLSRSSASFVRKLFELEVPEIANGEIVIKNMLATLLT